MNTVPSVKVPRYYVAYGSNLNLERMRLRCPDAGVVGTGELKDYALLFRGRASGYYLTAEPKPGGRVPVALWQVSEEDERTLDDYEDYPAFYYKADLTLPVTLCSTGQVELLPCFVYLMYSDFPLGTPAEDYMRECIRGYRDFGFDSALLEEALLRSK